LECVSIVSLSEQEFLQGVQLKVSARSALTKGLDSLTFVLIHPKVHLGHKSRARSAHARENLRVVNLSKHLEDYCCRCAQSQRYSALGSV
jgi:tRNA C32,U32 (ribose-2'-O)-methylase TrmJ